VQYTVHQLKQHPGKAALVVLAIILVAVLAYKAESPFFGLIALAIMVFSVSWFLFPIRYKISNRGIYWRTFFGSEQRGWNEFYDYGIYPDAVQLLFDYRNLRGRVRKGVLVYFDLNREQKEKLIESVKAHIVKPIKPAKPGKGDQPKPVIEAAVKEMPVAPKQVPAKPVRDREDQESPGEASQSEAPK